MFTVSNIVTRVVLGLYSGNVTMIHYYNVTIPHSHTISHHYTPTQSHPPTLLQTHFYCNSVTLLHCHTVKPPHRHYTTTHLYIYTTTPLHHHYTTPPLHIYTTTALHHLTAGCHFRIQLQEQGFISAWRSVRSCLPIIECFIESSTIVFSRSVSLIVISLFLKHFYSYRLHTITIPHNTTQSSSNHTQPLTISTT